MLRTLYILIKINFLLFQTIICFFRDQTIFLRTVIIWLQYQSIFPKKKESKYFL